MENFQENKTYIKNAFKFNNRVDLELALNENKLEEAKSSFNSNQNCVFIDRKKFIGRKFYDKPINTCLVNLLFTKSSKETTNKENKKIHTQKDLINHALEYNNYALNKYNDLIRKNFANTKFNYIKNSKNNELNENLAVDKSKTRSALKKHKTFNSNQDTYITTDLKIENQPYSSFSSILKSRELSHGLLLLYDNLFKLSSSCDTFTERYCMNKDKENNFLNKKNGLSKLNSILNSNKDEIITNNNKSVIVSNNHSCITIDKAILD